MGGPSSQPALVRGAHLILQLPSAAPRLPTGSPHISGREKAFKGGPGRWKGPDCGLRSNGKSPRPPKFPSGGRLDAEIGVLGFLPNSSRISLSPFVVCAQEWSQDCRLAGLRLERTLICSTAASGRKLFLILDPHSRPLGWSLLAPCGIPRVPLGIPVRSALLRESFLLAHKFIANASSQTDKEAPLARNGRGPCWPCCPFWDKRSPPPTSGGILGNKQRGKEGFQVGLGTREQGCSSREPGTPGHVQSRRRLFRSLTHQAPPLRPPFRTAHGRSPPRPAHACGKAFHTMRSPVPT